VLDAAKNMADMEAEFERKREEILCGQIWSSQYLLAVSGKVLPSPC